MTDKEIKINFIEYTSLGELKPEDRRLAEAAIEALKRAYAPFSNFNVGAAIRLSNGKIITGANQENEAFPSGLCAERTAMFYASAEYPEESMEEIAITGGKNGVMEDYPVTPCGACRQVMAEYQKKGGKPMGVLMIGKKKIWKFRKVEDILPLIFDSLRKEA
ncbi:MAG: cytidine deaminase [Bacteroidales bacterium]|jgi:cytidine deaminase|nr:cytidine deaminase [Bacteroidales bacterium]MCI1785927.1 cytidine deaminase [Bacteroidales bacterium]